MKCSSIFANQIVALLLAALSCLLSMQWASASSVTVVTHGADVWGFGGPLWDFRAGDL